MNDSKTAPVSVRENFTDNHPALAQGWRGALPAVFHGITFVRSHMRDRGQTKGYVFAVALVTAGAVLLGFRVLVPTLSPALHPLGLIQNLNFALMGSSLLAASVLALLADDWGNYGVFLAGLFALSLWF